MTKIVFDIEANGLLHDNPTKIWCIVLMNVDTSEVWEYGPDDIDAGVKHLHSADTLIGHNIIGYDLPLLKKFYPDYFWGAKESIDTLIMSQIFRPDIPGGHSLEAWGEKLGIKKIEWEDWSKWDPGMLFRCKEDVRLTEKLYQFMLKEFPEDSNRAYLIEQDIRHICIRMEQWGWYFDVEAANKLVAEFDGIISEKDLLLRGRFPLVVVPSGPTVNKIRNKNGEYSRQVVDWYGTINVPEISGPFTRILSQPINLNSISQIKNYFSTQGWKPANWNYKKDKHNHRIRDEITKDYVKLSPKFDIDDLGEFESPVTNTLAIRMKTSKRKSQLTGWLERLREDNRLIPLINPNGTNTARATHKNIANVPKAHPDVYYGKEIRALFTVPKGKLLVGWDMSSLEARMEAHYTFPYDDGRYAKEILEGDIHQKNANAFHCDRQTAKNTKYAITYGAGVGRLQEVLKCTVAYASALHKKFWQYNVVLRKLKEDLELVHAERGYLKAIDGRRLYIRYKHALTNTLFQSAGSICVKEAIRLIAHEIIKQEVNAEMVGYFHDECQFEVDMNDVDKFKKIVLECIPQAGINLGIRVPLAGEIKVGFNWSETH